MARAMSLQWQSKFTRRHQFASGRIFVCVGACVAVFAWVGGFVLTLYGGQLSQLECYAAAVVSIAAAVAAVAAAEAITRH